MKFLRSLLVVILVLITFSSSINAQDIATDSKSNPVFSYFSTPKVRADFSSKDFSLTVRLKTSGISYVRTDPNSPDTTVEKRSHLYIRGTILNADKMIMLSELEKFKPGGKLTIGYQWTVDSILKKTVKTKRGDSITKIYRGSTWAFGTNAHILMDNFNHYNQLNGQIKQQNPLGLGLEGNVTFFPPAIGSKRPFIITGILSYTYGSNKDALLNYKSRSETIIDPNVVAFKQFDGKYGTLVKDVHTFRGAISVPIALGYYNPIPYVVYSNSKVNGAAYFYGIYNNILLKEINFWKFSLPSSFGVGVEAYRLKGTWENPNIFVRGNITF